MEPRTDNDAVAEADASEAELDGDAATAEAGALLEADLNRLTGERDQMRALAQQVQADFENYKKQMLRRQTEHLEWATEGLVEQLLPVLDSFESALARSARTTTSARASSSSSQSCSACWRRPVSSGSMRRESRSIRPSTKR
jgi:molecular chaperone GrpE (heat shock protein)